MNIKDAIATLVGWKAYAAAAVAGVLVLALYTGAVAHYARKGVADRVQTKTITKFIKADTKETVRRETVIQKVQVRSAKDIADLIRIRAQLVTLQRESINASTAHDNDYCLDPTSVLRLAAIH